jgi:aldose 1-epimerase
MIASSGEQIEIAVGDQQAVVVEVGGGIRSYSAGSRELVDGYRADEMSSSGRGQVLIPWPNRLQDGRYEFDGRRHQLPLNEPEHRNAIHGLVRWANWTTAEREPHRAVMEHILHPQPGYPFSLRISIEYALTDSGLRVRTTARNLGTDPCPYGSGAHPYLTLGTATIDSLILRVPGRTVLRSDERGLPIGTEAVEHTEYNFQTPRQIGSTRLDHAFTDLERDEEGLARVELRDPDHGTEVSLWVDESYPYLMLFSGDPLPDVRRSQKIKLSKCDAASTDRNSTKMGETAQIKRLPPRRGFPEGVLATWGKVTLEPLDSDSIITLAEGRSPKKGYLIDFIGNFARSAKECRWHLLAAGCPGERAAYREEARPGAGCLGTTNARR